LFFTKFLQQGKAIASLVPSSPWLARAVVGGIDFGRCHCIVELGAGTGPITAELLPRLGGTCRALIIERDADFCIRLRQRFPAAEIIQADAGDLRQILEERGVEQVDHVLCGLPLPSFPDPLRDRILATVHERLVPEGTFRQLTHMPYVYYGLYRRYFRDVRFHFIFRNLPPAGFYTCTGCRPPGQTVSRSVD
jgi:phosphatidylethanolamine/phosphatidyl-N-methylethanolamine N-methyltransferase